MLNFWQSLQQFLKDNFNLQDAPAATIIISLLVFFLGFLIRGIINWVGEFRERRIIRHLFIDNLKGLSRQVEKQKNGFNETANSLDMKADSGWVFHKATFFQVSVFKEMKYSDTFKAYFLGIENSFTSFFSKTFRLSKYKSFYKVWENNSNLEFWADKIFNDFGKYLDKYNTMLEDWNKAVSELRLTWAEFFRERNGKELPAKEIEFANKLQAILLPHYSKTSDENIAVKPYDVHTNLVRPIKELSEQYELNVDTIKLIETSLKSVNAYIELDTFVNNVKSQIEAHRDMMEDILSSTQNAIKVLQKRIV